MSDSKYNISHGAQVYGYEDNGAVNTTANVWRIVSMRYQIGDTVDDYEVQAYGQDISGLWQPVEVQKISSGSFQVKTYVNCLVVYMAKKVTY